jgi:hypothetical protein
VRLILTTPLGFTTQTEEEEKIAQATAGFQYEPDFISSQKESSATENFRVSRVSQTCPSHAYMKESHRGKATFFITLLETPPPSILKITWRLQLEPKVAVPPRLCCLSSLL